MTRLGDMVLRTRSKRSMSLQAVADRGRLTKTHVWQLEQGRARNPCVSTLIGLSKALGTSPYTLARAAIEDMLD